jgi:hypothetical protein
MARSKQSKKQAQKKKRDLAIHAKGKVNGIGEGQFGVQYTAPSATTRSIMTRQPMMSGNSKSFLMKHREYIAEVLGSVDYANTVYHINPGLQALLAWGSGIAQNYEQYRIRSLKFVFETQAPTTAPGTVMMAIDYDPADGPPANKHDFMTFAGAVRSAVWNRVECSASQSRRPFEKLYVRDGSLDPNLDIKTYDYGVMNIATQGCASTAAVGELYVEYEFELLTPTQDAEEDEIYANAQDFNSGPAGGEPSKPFGTSISTTAGGLGITYVSVSSIKFPKQGNFTIFWKVFGSTITANAAPAISFVSGSGLLNVNNGYSNSAASTGYHSSHTEIYVGQPGSVLSVDFTGCVSVLSVCYAYVRGMVFTAPRPMKYTEMSTGSVVHSDRENPKQVACSSTSGPSCCRTDLGFSAEEEQLSRQRFLTEARRVLAPMGLRIGDSVDPESATKLK